MSVTFNVFETSSSSCLTGGDCTTFVDTLVGIVGTLDWSCTDFLDCLSSMFESDIDDLDLVIVDICARVSLDGNLLVEFDMFS